MPKIGVIPLGKESVSYHIRKDEAERRVREGLAKWKNKSTIEQIPLAANRKYSGPLPPAELPGLVFVLKKSDVRLPSECVKVQV